MELLKKLNFSRGTAILIGFVILKFVLQYSLISPEYDLHRDEYLHLDQGDHLQWGYLSVPPFTSWLSFIIKLGGNSVFPVKFFPALFGALTIVVVWKTVEELGGNLFACILGATGILFSVILRLNTLYQPNSFDVLAWTTVYLFLIKYVNSDTSKWIYMAAIAVATGFLNKYNILFLLFGLVPAILLSKQRRMFFKPFVLIAALCSFIIVLPNLLWQYNNNFPVVHHMQELAKTQLANVNRADFLKNQLLFFIGSFFVILAGLYALILHPPFKHYRLFFASFFFTLFVFIYLRAKDYYAIGLYPIYIAFGSAYLGQLLQNGRKRYLQPIAIAIPVIAFIPLHNIAFPNKSPKYVVAHQKRYKDLGMLRWEDGKDHQLPQDFADMLGWKELAGKVDAAVAKLPNKDRTLILCDNYGQAGAINYYTKNPKIKAVSFNADYIDWFKLDTPIYNFIRVKDIEGRGDEMMKTGPYFQMGFIADSIAQPLAREYGTTIFVFSNPKTDVNARLRKEVKERKAYR